MFKIINKSGNGVNEGALHAFWLALATFSVWGIVLRFGFVWDDFPTIVENASLAHPSSLLKAFTHDFWGLHTVPQVSGYWRPLPTIAYILIFQGFGASALAFHALNLLLHVGCVVLVYVLLRRWLLSSQKAFFGALLFSLHPIQAEAVAFVSALPDVLSAFFGLLGTWFFTKQRRNLRNDVLAVLFLVCALLSKESSVSFFLLWIFLDLLGERKPSSRGILVSALALVLYIALHLFIVSGTGIRAIWGAGWVEHLGTVSRVFLLHLGLNVLPLFSSPTRVLGLSSGASDVLAWAGLVTLLGMLFLGFRSRHRWPFLTQSIGMWLIFFLPYSNLIPGEGLIADRYLYLEIFAFGLFLLATVETLPDRISNRLHSKFFLIPFFLALAVWSFMNVQKWESEETLWVSAIRTDPESTLAWNEYGKVQLEEKDLDEALKAFQRALEIRPANRKASLNLVRVYRLMDNTDEAKERIRKHVKRFPMDAAAFDVWATVFLAEGKIREALDVQKKALALAPKNWKYLFNTGTLYLDVREWEEAEKLLRMARELQPRRKEIWMNLAAAQVRRGKIDQALQTYKRILDIWPEDPQAEKNRDAILRWKQSR